MRLESVNERTFGMFFREQAAYAVVDEEQRVVMGQGRARLDARLFWAEFHLIY